MSKQMWILAAIIAGIAVVTGYVVKNKTDSENSDAAANSQLPASEAEANYSVPPSIGASVDAGGNVYTSGNAVYTVSQGNSLPMSS
jgi:hypothetical protein